MFAQGPAGEEGAEDEVTMPLDYEPRRTQRGRPPISWGRFLLLCLSLVVAGYLLVLFVMMVEDQASLAH